MNIRKALSLVFLTAALSACDSVSEAIDGGNKDKNNKHTVRIIDPALALDESTFDHSRQDTFTVNNGESITVWPETWALGGIAEVESVTGCGGLTYMEEVQTGEGSWTSEHWVSGPITSDCTVTITYRSLLPDFHLVRSSLLNYGGSLSPSALTVIDGGSATFHIDTIEGYEAIITGCNGELVNDLYIVSSISDNCTVEANFKPKALNTVNVSITHTDGGSTPFRDFTIGIGETITLPIYPGIGYTPEVSTSGCLGELVDADTSDYTAYNYVSQPIENHCMIDIVFREDDPNNTRFTVNFDKPGNHQVESIFFSENIETNYHWSDSVSTPVESTSNHITYYIYPDPGFEIIDASTCSQGDQVFLNQYPARISFDGYTSGCDIEIYLKEIENRILFSESMRTHIHIEDDELSTLRFTNGDIMDSELCRDCDAQTLIHPQLWGTAVQFIVDTDDNVDFWFDDPLSCIDELFGDIVSTTIAPYACRNINVQTYDVN